MLHGFNHAPLIRTPWLKREIGKCVKSNCHANLTDSSSLNDYIFAWCWRTQISKVVDGAFSDHPIIDFNFVSILEINDITCRKRVWRPKETEAPAPATTDENNKQCDDEEAGQMEMKAPRISVAFSTNTVTLSDANKETWKEIARALDRVFFWVFLALILLSSFVIYAHAGQLASDDNFWNFVANVSHSHHQVMHGKPQQSGRTILVKSIVVERGSELWIPNNSPTVLLFFHFVFHSPNLTPTYFLNSQSFHCMFSLILFCLEEIIWRPNSDEKYTQRLCDKICLNRNKILEEVN
mgnify:CR=1 FL=1